MNACFTAGPRETPRGRATYCVHSQGSGIGRTYGLIDFLQTGNQLSVIVSGLDEFS